jgi:hypothetical protein
LGVENACKSRRIPAVRCTTKERGLIFHARNRPWFLRTRKYGRSPSFFMQETVALRYNCISMTAIARTKQWRR